MENRRPLAFAIHFEVNPHEEDEGFTVTAKTADGSILASEDAPQDGIVEALQMMLEDEFDRRQAEAR